MGYVPQVKAENVFGQSYSRISGMSKQGLIQAKRGDNKHNHFNNISIEDKFRSTFQEKFKDASKEIKKERPAEVFKSGYDTFDFQRSESDKYHY